MTAILEARDLGVAERLRGVTLSLHRGRALAVVGRNGSGKTTLLRALLGLERHHGEVVAGGVAVGALPPVVRAARMAWLPQAAPVPEGLTALDVVAAARFRFGEGRAASEAAARAALDRAGVGGLAARRLDTLSGGEAQRVRMAALDAQQADLWLLDEPGNHLDPSAQLASWARLGDAVRGGLGLVVVTHDVTLLPALGDVPLQVLGLDGGAPAFLVDGGDPQLIDHVGALLGLVLAAVPIGGRPRWVVVGAT